MENKKGCSFYKDFLQYYHYCYHLTTYPKPTFTSHRARKCLFLLPLALAILRFGYDRSMRTPADGGFGGGCGVCAGTGTHMWRSEGILSFSHDMVLEMELGL